MRDQFDISGVFETTEFEIAQVACTSVCIAYPVESCKISVKLFGSMLPNLKGH